MGCNCGKNKTTRASTPMDQAAQKSSAQQVREAQAARDAQRAALANGSAPMKGQTQTFALELRDGRRFTYGSRLEADAENVRLGYAGTVRAV